jgi:hypothetical protein
MWRYYSRYTSVKWRKESQSTRSGLLVVGARSTRQEGAYSPTTSREELLVVVVHIAAVYDLGAYACK